MKRLTIIAAFLLTLTTTYSFATPTDAVNGEISNSFKKEFRNAQLMSTEVHKAFTKLTFKMNEVILVAFYSDGGDLLAVTHNIVSTQLPIALQMNLKNNYSSYWITELFELNSDDESCYYISLENAEGKVTLRSNGDSWEVYTTVKK